MENMEELINKVQEYPILYDPSHADYKDFRIRNQVWDSIAESLQEKDGETVKGRWKNLRDCYSKHLRARNGDSSRYIVRYRQWPWVKRMSFLQPYMEFTPYITRGTKKTRTFKKNETAKLQTPFKKETTEHAATEDPIFIGTQETIEPTPNKYQYLNNEVASSNANINTLAYDETDLIFLGYSKLIKKMSRRQQAAVKYEIAKVIMDAEMDLDETSTK